MLAVSRRSKDGAALAECYEDKNDEATAMGEWAKAIAGDGNTTNADGTIPHPYSTASAGTGAGKEGPMLMATTMASATLRSAGTGVGSRSAARVLCMLTVMVGPPGGNGGEGAI